MVRNIVNIVENCWFNKPNNLEGKQKHDERFLKIERKHKEENQITSL